MDRREHARESGLARPAAGHRQPEADRDRDQREGDDPGGPAGEPPRVLGQAGAHAAAPIRPTSSRGTVICERAGGSSAGRAARPRRCHAPGSRRFGPRSWRPRSGPESRAALESVSASRAVSPRAVTPIRPVQAGSPVEGSSRWCANRPSAFCHRADVQPRRGYPARSQRHDVRAFAREWVLDLDVERPLLDREAANPDVPSAVDHEAPVVAEAPREQVGRQSLAGATGVEGHAGGPVDDSLAVVDIDPAPRLFGPRLGRLSRWGQDEGVLQRRGANPGPGVGVASDLELVDQRWIHKAAAQLRRVDPGAERRPGAGSRPAPWDAGSRSARRAPSRGEISKAWR